MRILDAQLRYERKEEHLLRRLGGALIVQWPNLPQQVRELMLDQAEHVHDRHSNGALREQMEVLIEKNQRIRDFRTAS